MFTRLFFVLALLFAFVGAAAAQDAPPPFRHVVMFVADDHGQDTGAYGNPVIRTPHLDALAAEGTRFTHAFATTASCSASRSVILSGLHNHRTGQFGHEHSWSHFRSFENLRTLPVLLGEAGYHTIQIGKYHVGPREVYAFETYVDGPTRNPVQMAENVRPLLEAEHDRPFFLYFATSDPHRGGLAPEREGYADLPAHPDGFGNRPEGRDGIEQIVYDPDDVIVPPWLPDSPATRAELAEYYQSVSRLDQGFGRLMEVLKAAGVYDQTLILYLSDHGIAMPGGKTTVYEPGLRSPLIVRHPEAERRGIVSEAMISWVDLTPTVLDFAGVEPPVYEQHISDVKIAELIDLPDAHGLHGRSFLEIVDEPAPPGWDEVFASHTFHEIQMYYPMRVVRDRDYKLIWNIAHGLPFPFATDLWAAATWQAAWQQGMEARYGARTVADYIHRPAFELYDMRADPYEFENLADDPAYTDVLKAYQERLRTFQARTSDPWALKWIYE